MRVESHDQFVVRYHRLWGENAGACDRCCEHGEPLNLLRYPRVNFWRVSIMTERYFALIVQ